MKRLCLHLCLYYSDHLLSWYFRSYLKEVKPFFAAMVVVGSDSF